MVETDDRMWCGHVADLIVMAHAFAELGDGVVARQHEERFQMWAQFLSLLKLFQVQE